MATSGESAYHEGERQAQIQAGTTEQAEANGAGLRASLGPGVCRFLSERTYAFVAAEAADGTPWISLAEAERGLFACLDEQHLAVHPEPRAGDPVFEALGSPSRIAILAIDLATRRRLRVNGRSRPHGESSLLITTAEVFGNCPKYIAQRTVVGTRAVAPRRLEVSSLDEWMEAIHAADCIGIATTHFVRGLDASHRGGRPGFLRVRSVDEIEWNDYAGNGMFQSNGNLLVDRRAALAIPVFDTGALLLLTGDATVEWGPPRKTTFHLRAGIMLEGATRSVFSDPEPSPFSPK